MLALLLLLGAFEFSCPAGPATAMLAGGATADWRAGLSFNPALADSHELAAAAMHTRPFGLEGLSWNWAGVHWQRRAFSVNAAASSLGLGSYHEDDIQVSLSGSPLRQVTLGVACHCLAERMGRAGTDIAPAIDAGVSYATGNLSVAASLLRLNQPRWRDDTDLPVKLLVSGSWRPVPALLLATDVSREEDVESASFGAEFRIIPPLGLRLGVAAVPLRYAGGIGAEVGPLSLDYAWQYHPLLKGTHILGLSLAWR